MEIEPYIQSIERLYLGTHEIDIGTHPANQQYVEFTIRLVEEAADLEANDELVKSCYLVLNKNAVPVLMAALDKFKQL